MSDRPLTMEEIEALPDDTEIWITWSGGNGPAKWKTRHNKWESLEVYRPWEYGEGETVRDIDFVGPESPSSIVTLHNHGDLYKRTKR